MQRMLRDLHNAGASGDGQAPLFYAMNRRSVGGSFGSAASSKSQACCETNANNDEYNVGIVTTSMLRKRMSVRGFHFLLPGFPNSSGSL